MAELTPHGISAPSAGQGDATMEHNASRCVLAFVAVAAGGMLLLVGLNVLVDPFGAWGVTLISAESRSGETRTARAELLHAYSGETVLIGSSRTRIGYDGSLPWIPGGPALNVGLDGTSLHELALVVEQAARNPRLRRIVLSLDLHLFTTEWQPNSDFRNSRFNPDRSPFAHGCDLLLNGRTLEASCRALRQWWRNVPPQHDALGFAVQAGQRLAPTPQAVRTAAALQQFLGSEGLLRRASPDASSYRELRTLLQRCRDRGVDVTLVIDPVHALLLAGLDDAGLRPAYHDWKRAVVAIAADEGVPVWDFTGCHPYTTEPLLSPGAPEAHWFWEPSHMRRELGDRVLARIFAQPGADATFGVQLTPETFETAIAQMQTALARWRRDTPGELAALALPLRPEQLTSPSVRAAAAPGGATLR